MIPDDVAKSNPALEPAVVRRYQSRILGRLCLVTTAGFAGGALTLAGLALVVGQPLLGLAAALNVLGAAACLGAYRLVRLGHYRASAWIFEVVILCAIALDYWLVGGDSTLPLAVVVPIISAVVLLPSREALVLAGVALVEALALVGARGPWPLPAPAVVLSPALASIMDLAIVAIVVPVSTALLLIPATSLARLIQGQNRRLRRDNAALRQIQVELRHSLAQQQVLYQEAQQAIRVREEFLSIASHELKTPLTGLSLLIQILNRQAREGRLAGQPAERLSDQLGRAERQTRHLDQLIDRLLDISRIASGRVEMVLEDVDLSAVVRTVSEELAPELAGAGCTLTLHLVPVAGRWDRTRLEQIVVNLLSNALKYGRGRPIDVKVERQGGTAVLVVADQGIGIAADDVERIFQRFERAVATDHYGGFGLGLYIVHQIVSALGGTISVRSAPGAGAAFRVELPVAGPP